MAIFPPRVILAPWLSEATCLPLLTRMSLADVFPITLSLDWTQGKLSAAWFPEKNPQIQTSGLQMKFWRLCVDSLKCWIHPCLQHIALSFTLSCWTRWGPPKPCLLIYFVVRLLLFLHKCLWFDLWDVRLTETDILFKMCPTMIPCKVGTMLSTNKNKPKLVKLSFLGIGYWVPLPWNHNSRGPRDTPANILCQNPKSQPNSI